MKLTQSGPVTMEFMGQSMKIYDTISSAYESEDMVFAICDREEDIYRVFAKTVGFESPAEMDPHPSLVIDPTDSFGVINLRKSEGKDIYLIYTCEELMDPELEGDLFGYASGNLCWFMPNARKKPPVPMVV
jgi:hypothetical protein